MNEISKQIPEVKLALRSLNALYAQVPEEVADNVKKNILSAFDSMENHMHIDLLVALQAELGYVKGDINTVAMLGLVGEAGEVLNEMHVGNNGSEFIHHVMKALDSTKMLDNIKKDVRKKKVNVSLHLTPANQEKFDSELADTYYYIQILATNRGLTISQLAKMAHDKIRAKQAAGGSSEDKKS